MRVNTLPSWGAAVLRPYGGGGGLMAEKRLELVRGLGAWASGAIVVGTMLGTGVFLKPAEMAREGRFVSVVVAAWIVGAGVSLCVGRSYAGVGAASPEGGGACAH